MAIAWKRASVGLVAAVLSVAVVGCGGAKQTTNTPAAPAAEEKITKLVVGFVPSADAAKISDKVKPMSEFLAKELGLQVETFVGTNFMATVEGMGSKKVDVAFLNPLSYVMAHGDYEAKILLKTLRKGADTYRAQLTVRKDSGIPVCDTAKDATCKATFDALKGKKLAFVDAASTSGYLFPASYMKSNGIDFKEGAWFTKTAMTGSHDNAIKQVYNKEADASWTFEDARDNLVKAGMTDAKDVLVQAAFTTPIPNDTVTVRKGLPADLEAKIKAAFLKYVATEEGKKVLTDLYTVDGFKEASDADYKVVKDMATNMGVDIKAEISKPAK
ncbi:MAG TPA: phosphate/phosphite/phosphonate ABC transporter substrate-binding protein [Symbiobacteriaceae bacterium]|nr:phosphate/phosphite/phosphonate ABC transporter substrate-binding protein [Symbiobacteriaceae bacterium]